MLSFKLQVFEGPLELLLHLIQKNKVSIYDIPISMITSQYLEYIEEMCNMDIELTSEFIVMAAELLYIKSKMLLPKSIDETEEDPRDLLIDRLIEYAKYKNSIEFLNENINSNKFIYFKEPDDIELPKVRPIEGNIPIEALVKVFNDVMELKELHAPIKKEIFEVIIKRDSIPVRSRISYIFELFKNRKSISFREVFGDIYERSVAVSTFLAVLEIIRSGQMSVKIIKDELICILKGDENEYKTHAGYN